MTKLPLGLESGHLVMEINAWEDSDDSIRTAFVDATGESLLDEDNDEVVDAVLLWWRDDDGDLFDALVDALTPLTDSGTIWLLTPKQGHDGHVEPVDIAEAAATAGLQQTSTINAGPTWQGTRLVAARQRR